MELTPGIAIVFGLVAVAAVLFAIPRVPNDMTAIGAAVGLALLGRWTGVGPLDAISGFASPAVITVLAMFILSEAVRRTGIVQRVGRRLFPFTRKSERRQLAVTLGLGGPAAGFVNNTPLVAILTPLVEGLARRHRTSPSKLLLPLSYIAMMGGMLTVIGTSANLLASDLSGRLLDHPISMFEFTPLGLLALAVGALYLMTVGRRLTPARIRPEEDLTQTYRMREYLQRVRVPAESPLVGLTIRESQAGEDWDLDILQVVRGEKVFLGPVTDQTLDRGDRLTLRADAATAAAFARAGGLEPLPRHEVTDDAFLSADHTLLEAVVAPDSALEGESLVSIDFRRRFGPTVLAVRRGEAVTRDRIEHEALRAGDALLLLAPRELVPKLDASPALEITRRAPLEGLVGAEEEAPSRRETALALGTLAGVVAVAAAGLVPIYLAALAGVVVVVATGCLTSGEAYGAVNWGIIFLLVGILPLGVAMDRTGAAEYLAAALLEGGGGWPPVVVLGLFYLLASAIASLITSNAAVVLMIPVAADAARQLGADPFAFVLAVMFGASTAFTTPVGYQTNLMVLTPGGYRFADYLRVGGPLQLLLALVTTAGIALFWGL